MNVNQMHKLIVKSKSAATACGLKIACYYPMSDRGMRADTGEMLCCTTENEYVTGCDKCVAHTKGERP